ncbi:MAG: GNAT family N-acetyltransferase [Eudoraea sp.]|uniref:GNAT family N-acetyltransferase n=1 Tax=Eudoraea sp. TaxID=1979955 RepID=UPI003C786BEB
MDFLKVNNNFNFDFYTLRKIYGCYHNIYNRTTEKDYYNNADKIDDYPKKDIIVVNNIPAYFDARINQENGTYKLFKVYYLDGFLVNLKEFINLDSYIKAQFGSKSRSNLRKFVNRLETCFDIRYEMYYGEITNKKFHFLMNALEKMISRRFLQRGDTHESLKNWDDYINSTYSMILEKKASLFVIYDGDKPIYICLNYHHQNILFFNIPSYDIDYSKFRLGSIAIMKLLDWCFSNNYTILDLSYGNLDYKHKWCNSKYIFEHHVIYNKRKVHIQFKAFIIAWILRLKAFLKKRKIDLFYHKIVGKQKRSINKKGTFKEINFTSKEITKQTFNDLSTSQIDINCDDFAFLRKTVYDLQYLNFEFTADIKVYKLNTNPNEFVVLGLNKTAMLTLVNNPYNH